MVFEQSLKKAGLALLVRLLYFRISAITIAVRFLLFLVRSKVF